MAVVHTVMGRSLILFGAVAVMTRRVSARPTVNVAERLEYADDQCLLHHIDAILEAHDTYKTYMQASIRECIYDLAFLDDLTPPVLDHYTRPPIEEGDDLWKCINDDYCLQFYYDAQDAMDEVVKTYVARNLDRPTSPKREGS